MRELFFIVLVFAQPDGGVEMVAQRHPYESAQQCIDASGRALDEAHKRSTRARGALCYTIDEMTEFAPGALRTMRERRRH